MGEDAGITILLCFLLLVCLPNHHHLLLVASPSTSPVSCHPEQRDALLRFIHSFSITDSNCPSTSYPKVASWREEEDCCSWDGVTCDNSTGDVIGLDLTCARLHGSIDSSSPLFSLRQLRSLSLAGNDLLGSAIPPEIGMFTWLEYLDLSSSSISDILPMEISLLSKLFYLNLSYNIGLAVEDDTMKLLVGNQTQMEELDLGYVDMSTVAPTSFMNFSSSLISLKLTNCLLGGKFPEFIFGLPNLQVLDISWNDHLTGILPESKWSLSLDYLSLGYCNFTGAVPNSIGNLSRLTYLDLSYNNFNDELDLWILSTLEDLHFLHLSEISVLGEDANHRFSLPKLRELYMESCNLSKFPSFLSRSKELRFLLLRGNKIQEIPDWLWSIGIDTLTELYLENNIIKGSISPSICRLTALFSVDLSGNYLTDEIPRCLGNLTKLLELSLSYNSLSGSLPPSLANCTSLWRLDVSNNSINGGGWPSDIFLRSASLKFINLSDNKLEGPLPVPYNKTFYYSVSNNHFYGEISSVMCNATNLQLLDLSNNNLTGVLPDCFRNIIGGLVVFNLRANEFYGQIPDIFHEGSNLMSIDLSKNQFEGPLPRSLSHCKNLEALDVGNNKITDSFPNWLGDLPLKVISLRSNRFRDHVNISTGTHPFTMARILDLSRNSFDGNLQDEFIGEMSDMMPDDSNYIGKQYMHPNSPNSEYYSVMIDLKGVEMEMVKINVQFAMLDLSGNHFHGEIPKSIGLLKSLKGLNFSHNHFTGKIPPSVENLVNLESFDLSSNHLMGEIPKELVKLTSLGFLDLSRNNLTGPIPLGGHFNTFPNSSFQDNLGLCGIPLTRLCGQGNKKARPPSEGKDSGEEGGGEWMEWKYVALGFGSGMGMGLSLGYMVLEMGRPLWLLRMVMSFIT